MKIKRSRGHRDGIDRPGLHTITDSSVVSVVVTTVLEQHVVQFPVLILLLLLLELELLLVLLLEVSLGGIKRKVVEGELQSGLI